MSFHSGPATTSRLSPPASADWHLSIPGAVVRKLHELAVRRWPQKGQSFLMNASFTRIAMESLMINGQALRILMIVLALGATAGGSIAAEIVGRVREAVTGSAFILCDGENCKNIRLCGIDTPPEGYPGWERSLLGLHTLVDNQTVRCVPLGEGTVCDGRTRNANTKGII